MRISGTEPSSVILSQTLTLTLTLTQTFSKNKMSKNNCCINHDNLYFEQKNDVKNGRSCQMF